MERSKLVWGRSYSRLSFVQVKLSVVIRRTGHQTGRLRRDTSEELIFRIFLMESNPALSLCQYFLTIHVLFTFQPLHHAEIIPHEGFCLLPIVG